MCPCKKKNQARLPAPIALIGDFPIYQENHSGDTSTYTLKTMRKWTVRIKSFIFCCCGPLNSQNEAQEVPEVKKTVDGNTKIAFPEIYPADRPPAPLKLLLALSGHKIWATSQPQPLSHPYHPPTPAKASWAHERK